MMVQMPDLAPDLVPDPKIFEILKFDDLTDFKVFCVMNGIHIKYD